MRILETYEGFVDGAEKDIRALLIEPWVHKHLTPLLPRGAGDLRVRVKKHSKGDSKYSISLRLPVPHKKMLVAQASNADLRSAVEDAENKLLKEVQKHNDFLRHTAEYRRKARRERLRELKLMAAERAEPAADDFHGGIQALLPRLRRIVRRDIEFLRAGGDLPLDTPGVNDIVDEAVARVYKDWKPGTPEDKTLVHLLREAFRAIDREVEITHNEKNALHLEHRPLKDAEDTSEEMVEEELYEFYQPDEVIHLEDIVPDEEIEPPESQTESDQRSFAIERIAQLPALWRRVLILAEWEDFEAEAVAEILDLEHRHAESLLAQARDFMNAHFKQAGFTPREQKQLFPAKR